MNAFRVGGWPSGRPSCVQPRNAFIMLKKMARVRIQVANHNECVACGRAALVSCKLLAATQGIHYDYLLAVGELCENDLGHESARARLVDL